MSKKTIIILTSFCFLFSCMRKEYDLAERLMKFTKSHNIKFYYTEHEIPKIPKRTIDIEIDGSQLVEDEVTAKNISVRTAIYVFSQLEQDKLDENQEIRISFLSPSYPNTYPENYYRFTMDELRKAIYFMDISQNILTRFYTGIYWEIEEYLIKSEINSVDSILNKVLPIEGDFQNVEFGTYQTFTNDTSTHLYTGLVYVVNSSKERKEVSIVFDNSTNNISEITSTKNKNH